jgi:hypothetical protein
MADKHVMPIHTATIGTPGPQQGILPIILDDIIPPRYPTGCNLVFQRPGELGVVVTIAIPVGAMVCVITPDEAEGFRPQYYKAKAQMEAAVKRMREAAEHGNGVGR